MSLREFVRLVADLPLPLRTVAEYSGWVTTGEDGRHLRTCPLCEAMCGLEIQVDDGKVTSIRGNRDDVWSRGHICPKGVSLAALHDDPDRIRRPSSA